MTGDAAGEHTYTTAWLKYVAPVVLGTVAIIGLQVHWWATGTTAPGSWWIPVAALVLTVAYLWAVPRRMVRRAVLDGRRLRVTTLTGSRDIALTELTGIAWNAAGGGAAGPMNLFGMVSARIRHRGGELLVPMPDGADLLRELEGVRPELVAAGEGAALLLRPAANELVDRLSTAGADR